MFPYFNAINHFRCEDKKHRVKAGSLQHWVPSFGYVIEEKPKPGKYVKVVADP